MKKNVYGNIDDMVRGMKVVTPIGVLSKESDGPRMSMGPDVFQMVLGSEGTVGVVTEVTLKVTKLPEMRKFASFVFQNFHQGVNFMYEVAQAHIWPASIRLVDNDQFVFGQALKPSNPSKLKAIVDSFSKAYLTEIKGFKLDEICAVTIQYEGDRNICSKQESAINRIASNFGAVAGGAENGVNNHLSPSAPARLSPNFVQVKEAIH